MKGAVELRSGTVRKKLAVFGAVGGVFDGCGKK